jgi:hypothetical protein
MPQIFQRIADLIGSFIFQCGKNLLNGTEAEAAISRVMVNCRRTNSRIFRNPCQGLVYYRVRISRAIGISECQLRLVLPLSQDVVGCKPSMPHIRTPKADPGVACREERAIDDQAHDFDDVFQNPMHADVTLRRSTAVSLM